jgi:hypothetical protein
MVVQLRPILLCAVLVALPAACADDEAAAPTTTLEEAEDACLAYAEASCRKFASCRGDESEIDGCLTLASGRCARHVEENTCWEGLRAGYEDCLAVEDAACEDLCDQDGVCIHSCYFEECAS